MASGGVLALSVSSEMDYKGVRINAVKVLLGATIHRMVICDFQIHIILVLSESMCVP